MAVGCVLQNENENANEWNENWYECITMEKVKLYETWNIQRIMTNCHERPQPPLPDGEMGIYVFKLVE